MASLADIFYDLAANIRRDSSRRTAVESFKTLFLAALMSAAAYGVYITVTAKPAAAPPKEAPKDWDNPQVELPADGTADAASDTASAAGAAPSDPFGGPSPPIGESPPPFEAAGAQGAAPPSYPSTDPKDASAANAALADSVRYPATDPQDATDPAYPAADVERYPSQPPAAQEHPADNRFAETLDSSAVPAGYESPPANAGAVGREEFVAAWTAAIALLDQNKLAEAHLAFSEWYGNPILTPEDEAQLLHLLDRLAGTVIYSRQHLLERPHEVQPGETLEQIAGLYEVPWELLANINGIRDPQRLRTGEQLKVIRGPFNALVELDKFRLTLFVQGRYAGRFKVGIGKEWSTPEGEFEILNKVLNPAYYGTDAVIDQDDPNNPLGEYALDLGDNGKRDHLLIHGTNDPQSIGRAESRGCIRLADRDIKDVFEILTMKTDRSPGSKVTIRR